MSEGDAAARVSHAWARGAAAQRRGDGKPPPSAASAAAEEPCNAVLPPLFVGLRTLWSLSSSTSVGTPIVSNMFDSIVFRACSANGRAYVLGPSAFLLRSNSSSLWSLLTRITSTGEPSERRYWRASASLRRGGGRARVRMRAG